MSLAEALDVAGVSAKTMSRWIAGTHAADAHALGALAAWRGVSLDWLLLGRGQMDGSPDLAPEPEQDLVAVPMLVATASAGGGALALSDGVQSEWLLPRSFLKQFGTISALKLFPIKGGSMEPTVSDGDWALVNTTQREPRDGLVVARLDDDLLLKRLQIAGREVRLLSDNPRYPDILIDEGRREGFEVLGRVRWTMSTVRD